MVHGPGNEFRLALAGIPDGKGDGGELRTIIRMVAADELAHLDPLLLRRLLPLSATYEAAELLAALHEFVEAGGQLSGGQLVLASLASLGFSYRQDAAGTSVSSCHNTTILREAWYDLKGVWQLACRPEVASGLWP